MMFEGGAVLQNWGNFKSLLHLYKSHTNMKFVRLLKNILKYFLINWIIDNQLISIFRHTKSYDITTFFKRATASSATASSSNEEASLCPTF